MNNKTYLMYVEQAARWYVCLMLNAYGWGKIFGKQFYLKGHLPPDVGAKTLDTVGSFDIAWAFMGYSYTYIFFIDAFQVIGGILLLWNKTKLVGTAILIPILLNVIVFDAVFFEGFYAALVSACFYFSLILYILYFNRFTLKIIFYELFSKQRVEKTNKKATVLAGTLLVAIFFGIEQFIQHWLRS